jgi:hypothetical protein
MTENDKDSHKQEEWPSIKRLKELHAEIYAALGIVRLSVNINMETARTLKEITQRSGISYTEAIRRAISVAHLLYGESRKGKRIVIADKKGREIKEIILK